MSGSTKFYAFEIPASDTTKPRRRLWVFDGCDLNNRTSCAEAILRVAIGRNAEIVDNLTTHDSAYVVYADPHASTKTGFLPNPHIKGVYGNAMLVRADRETNTDWATVQEGEAFEILDRLETDRYDD